MAVEKILMRFITLATQPFRSCFTSLCWYVHCEVAPAHLAFYVAIIISSGNGELDERRDNGIGNREISQLS